MPSYLLFFFTSLSPPLPSMCTHVRPLFGQTVFTCVLPISAPTQVSRRKLHPQYSNDNKEFAYDLAVLSIENPPSIAEFNAANVGQAAFNAFTRFPRPGRRLAVVGHGRTIGNVKATSLDLKFARVVINSWSQCNTWWRKSGQPENQRSAQSEALQVCGGLGARDTVCAGDSGGPVFERTTANGRTFYKVFAVVSYGFSPAGEPTNLCGTLNPSYFAKTSVGSEFIRAELRT